MLIENAAIWWYSLLKIGAGLQTWENFVSAVLKNLVLEDHERRARDALRLYKQAGSAAEYLSTFRNTLLTIPEMSSSEK